MVEAQTLREFPYFKWATADSLATLSMVSEKISFKGGDEMFRKGEPAHTLYVLTEGEVAIQYLLSSGERRTVDKLGPGDLVVWSSIVEPYVHTAFGVATTDCSGVAVDAARLRQVMDEDGELYQGLMSELVRVIASRLTGARRRLAELG
jgi:CRP-like cAMP-binding protein